MKVEDLLKQLEELDKEMEILVASDEEGNQINNLHSAQTEKYVYYDHVGEWEAVDPDEIEEYDDEYKKQIKDYLVLWP